MKEIGSLKNLRWLDVARTQISHLGLKEIAGCPINGLNLSYTPVSEETFVELAKFPDLWLLNLSGVSPKTSRRIGQNNNSW